MPKFMLVAAATLGLVGFALASYGVLRESFAELSKGRPYGEGRYGEGAYGGPGRYAFRLVAFGVVLRLLPGDQKLTVTDRHRNAAFAIAGVTLGAVALVAQLALVLCWGR